MAAQLDADITQDIESVIHAAHDMLESANWFYDTQGEIPAHMLVGIEAMQDDMIRLLALFEDGALYGKAPAHVTRKLRMFEQDACEILTFHGKLAS